MTKFNALLFHPGTAKSLDLYINNPSHGVMLTGAIGAGKKTAAKILATELLGLNQITELDSYPHIYFLKKPEGKQDIPIENVRSVINSLQLKVPGNKKTKKIIIIEDADKLSIPAQNALLKNLEEPSLDTVFILTSSYTSEILPTITSRVQELMIYPVSLDQAIKYWHDKHDESEIESVWQLSQGAVGLISVLLTDKNHPLKSSVNDAKDFLRQSTYQRLLMVDKMSKNKDNFKLFLEALSKILRALHLNAVKNDKRHQASKILKSRKTVMDIYNSLDANVNYKLAAMNLALNLDV